MKKLMLGMLMIISQQLAMAQYKLSGTVTEKNNEQTAISGATVEVAGNGTTQTDSEGRFYVLLRQKGTYLVRISTVAFKQFEQTVTVSEKETKLAATLEVQPLFLKPVEVSAIRAGDRMPFAKTNRSGPSSRRGCRRQIFRSRPRRFQTPRRFPRSHSPRHDCRP